MPWHGIGCCLALPDERAVPFLGAVPYLSKRKKQKTKKQKNRKKRPSASWLHNCCLVLLYKEREISSYCSPRKSSCNLPSSFFYVLSLYIEERFYPFPGFQTCILVFDCMNQARILKYKSVVQQTEKWDDFVTTVQNVIASYETCPAPVPPRLETHGTANKAELQGLIYTAYIRRAESIVRFFRLRLLSSWGSL